jgi:DNA polymerase III epsilon subunit family exonuclease
MQTFRNLVPDSALIQEAIQLLRTNGGRAHASSVAETVLQLPGLDERDAVPLVSELIKDDWRLKIAGDSGEVEFACEDDERRPLDETDYVVFDVETTGPKTPPKSPPDRILELGAVRVHAGKIVGEFQTLLNPRASIPVFISRLTGITDAMVRKAPAFEDVADDWLDFAGTAVLVAHDAPFDVRFINHELSRVFPGRRMANTHLCTFTLARRLFPELGFYRLHALAEHFAVPLPNHHRAASDARATAEILLRLLPLLHQHGIRDVSSARGFRNGVRKKERRARAAHADSPEL